MNTSPTKTFKGLSLQPADAFQNIATMISAGMLISVADSEDSSDLSGCIFCLAARYAQAAHQFAHEQSK